MPHVNHLVFYLLVLVSFGTAITFHLSVTIMLLLVMAAAKIISGGSLFIISGQFELLGVKCRSHPVRAHIATSPFYLTRHLS